jgi:hypothetical protein
MRTGAVGIDEERLALLTVYEATLVGAVAGLLKSRLPPTSTQDRKMAVFIRLRKCGLAFRFYNDDTDFFSMLCRVL